MKRLFAFIKTPHGSVILLAAFILVGTLLFGGRQNFSVSSTAVSSTPAPMERHTVLRDGQLFKVPTPLPQPPQPQATPSPSPKPDDAESAPRPHSSRKEETRRAPAALPISLLAGNSGSNGPSPPSSRYAPYGRLIPCETIITLESSKLDTPIIGLVTEDVWHEGRLIIPAGAEVHGRTAVDRARERIAASGQWLIVWRDRTTLNGMELTVHGIALDRERNETTGEFGLSDGSAGLVGQVIKTDDWQEIKLFASTFLSGMATGLQDLRDTTSITGDVTQVPKSTARNASLAGASNVLNTYAAQVAKMIAQDGFFVRVPAGKQFYLYVTQTLDQAKATRANTRARLWQQNGDNAVDDENGERDGNRESAGNRSASRSP
jgi:hypothetical protein